jgi:glycosyltransferase involved in cell wall biosynthesis
VVLGIDASRAAGPRTGVGRNVQHLLRAWSTQASEFESIRIFAPAPIDDLPADPRFRLEVLPSGMPGIVWQTRALGAAARDVDLLFTQYTLPLRYQGRSVVNNLGIYEGTLAFRGVRARGRSWHMGRSARAAGLVIANSHSTKRDIVRFFEVPEEKIVVVWPGVSESFRPQRDGDEDEIRAVVRRFLGERSTYFLFVGKLSARRNVLSLLDAFAIARARHPDLGLLVVGPNTEGLALDARISELGLGSSVHHVDFLDHTVLAPLYRGARAFVLPTEHEGFSFTIPEALASGCPVVTLRHAALAEAGLEDATLAVESPDAEVLANALLRVVEDDGLHNALRERGLQAARGLSWDETARRTMRILEGVARGDETPR